MDQRPIDSPPDDFVQNVIAWLTHDIYPNHLREPFDFNTNEGHAAHARMIAVWVSGDRGFVRMWQEGMYRGQSANERLENIKHRLYERITQTKANAERPSGPPVGTFPGAAVKGRVQLVGGGPHGMRIPADGFGSLFIPVAAHYGSALSDWVHGKQAEVHQNLDDIAAAGYFAIRPFTHLGYYDVVHGREVWQGRECTPFEFLSHTRQVIRPTPDYWGQKRTFIEELHRRGLKIMDDRGDLNGLDSRTKLEFMRENGRFYASLGEMGREVLAGLWACNEAWQNGVEEPEMAGLMLEAFREGAGWWPDVRGLSCPPDASEERDALKAWAVDPATVVTVHGNRVPNEHIIGHYHYYGYDGDLRRYAKLRVNTEPVGGGEGVTVGRVDDTEMLLGISTVARMTGQWWTHMGGRAVFGGLLREDPAFWETPRINQHLPHDIATFAHVGHGGDTWKGTRIVATEFGRDVMHTRGDFAIHDDGRFCLLLYKQRREHIEHPPVMRAIAHYKAIDLSTNAVVDEGGRVNEGQRLYTPDYAVARLITGRLA